jgi:cellobiose phosphorylase
MLVELCRLLGKEELAATHEQMGLAMRERIETYGWDGQYYLTAINDQGEPIGSHKNDEGQIWLNAQLWAVLAKLRPREQLLEIMKVVDERLESPYGTRITDPPYTKPHNHEGTYALQPPGTLLNASPYAHPNAWKLGVEAILGRADKVEETLRKILPWDHTYGKTMGEPYILYNMYHGAEAGYRAGTPGQSWRTASHSWVLKSLTRFVLGICPTMEGLTLTPCLPPSWESCRVRKVFRGCTYEIRYKRTGVPCVKTDGKVWTQAVLPYRVGDTVVVDYEY